MTTNAFTLWRDEAGFGTPVFFTDVRPFHPINALLASLGSSDHVPATLLLVLGILTTAFAADRFAAKPTRMRWAAFCLTFAVAITGCSLAGILALVIATAIAFVVRAVRGAPRDDQGAAAGLAAGVLIGALLALPWWLPMFAMRGLVRGDPPLNTEELQEARKIVNRPKWRVAETFAVDYSTSRSVRRVMDAPDLTIVDHIPAPVEHANEFDSRGGVNRLPAAHIIAARGLTVDVAGEGWKLLTSNRAWWPGWRAYVGRARLRPLRTDAAFLGVFVPPGAASVEFRYRPDTVDAGLRVAGGALLLFFATALWPFYRRATLRLPGKRDWRPAGIAVSLDAIDGRMTRVSRYAGRARALAVVLLIAYTVLLMVFSDAIAGGADSSGYLSQARLWTRGRLITPIASLKTLDLPSSFDGVFMPLGFVRGVREGTMVPSYPPGLPLHFAAAMLLFGDASVRFVVPLLAVVAVILMFLLARAAGASRAWSFVAASLLALCPAYVFHAIQPVSDVAATFWVLLAAFCALRADRQWIAAAAGAAFAMGVLVRPTNILFLPALLILVRRPLSLIPFGVAAAPFAIFQLWVNATLYGSPFASGYGDVGELLSMHGTGVRLQHYLFWLAAQLPLAFPFGLAALAMRRIDRRTRIAAGVWFLAFMIFYTGYSVYEAWWYVRFLLPAVPAILLLAALAASTGMRRFAALSNVAAVGAAMVLLAAQLALVLEFDLHTTNRGERIYPELIAKALPYFGADALVLTTQFSGALHYYTGRAPSRIEYLNPESFATLRSRAAERRRPVFALVNEWEIRDLRKHAPGNWVPIMTLRDATLFRLQQ